MTMLAHRPRLAIALAAFTVLSTACGSTIQRQAPAGSDAPAAAGADELGPHGDVSATAAAQPGGSPLGEPDDRGPASTSGSWERPSTSGGSAAGTGTSPGPASGPEEATTSPSQAPTPSAAGDTPAAGPQDRTPVKLGFIVLKNGGYVMAGLGTEVSFGDGELQARAVVEEVNRTGGVGGRPIEPYFAEVDVAASDPESNYNAACSKLTEDDGVFAVLTVINPPQSFIGCVANHRTLLLNASFSPGDDFLYREFGDWFFSPTLTSFDRGARLMLETARAEGRLEDGVKVGILYYDGDPQPRRVVDNVMMPLLEGWGVPFETAAVSGPEQVSGAQLRFAAAGVNLVMFQTPNGIAQLLFMNSAENQRYRPQYYTTDPDSTRFVSENAPRAQARNIAGVGTLPVANVPVRSYPTTPEEEECLKLIREAGENDTDRLSSLTATLYCELVYTFEVAGERVDGPMTHDAWRAAFRSVGTDYTPLSTFGVDFSNGRNDNATLFRTYGWDDGCNCLSYTSPSRPIPRS